MQHGCAREGIVGECLRKTALGVVLGGCLLLLGSTGCAWQQHGVIMRHECTWELNRVPWLQRRMTSYAEGSQCSPGCLPPAPGGCVAEPLPTAAPPPMIPQAEQAAMPAASDCQLCASQAPGRRIRPCRGCGRGFLAAAPVAVAAETAHYVPPRFHPVPTRPVFAPEASPAPEVHRLMQPPGGTMPAPQIEIVPPMREVIPTPPASAADEDRVTQTPRRLAVRSRGSSWIFNPPAAE